ncbi:hypothetical protein FKM82_013495 [Ascaphus truei]
MKSFEFLILGSLFGFVTADSLKIRLVEGNTSCNGRLEVHHNGEWGTVCDDQWDRLDSKVVCKELGCGSPKFIYNCDKFREGSGPIWLDEVNCTGREPSLSECKANAHGVHDCTHSEDVGVGCKGTVKISIRPPYLSFLFHWHDMIPEKAPPTILCSAPPPPTTN